MKQIFKKLFAFRSSLFAQRGQVLLLSILVLSGIIISTSFFVGFLMVQRLKQAALAIDSAQAFYLSDSGVEFELYKMFKNNNYSMACPSNLPNGVEIDSSIEVSPDSFISDVNLGLVIKSTGHVKNVDRGYDVSRSQMDYSQNMPKNVLCGDPAETDYNQNICPLEDGSRFVAKTACL